MNRGGILLVLVALLPGCASYDGRGLVAGRSTAVEAEALMGAPAATRPTGDGGRVLYFTRAPLGRHTYAVSVGPDGVLRGVEQVLTWDNTYKLVAGTTTKPQVRDLLGPPGLVSRLPRQEREVWEYKWLHFEEKRVLWVQFSDDGIVREALNMRDFAAEPPSGHGRRR